MAETITQPMTVTEGELAEIRERAEKATAGPWESDGETHILRRGKLVDGIVAIIPSEMVADHAFIAHSRTDVIRLLDSIDSYRAEIERLTREVHDFEAQMDFLISATVIACAKAVMDAGGDNAQFHERAVLALDDGDASLREQFLAQVTRTERDRCAKIARDLSKKYGGTLGNAIALAIESSDG